MTALSLLYLALLDAARAASIAVGMVALFLVWDGLGWPSECSPAAIRRT